MQFGAKIKNDEEWDRTKLLDLYEKLVLPKPQRELDPTKRSQRDRIERRNKMAISTQVAAIEVTNRKRPGTKTEEVEAEAEFREDSGEPPQKKKSVITWP